MVHGVIDGRTVARICRPFSIGFQFAFDEPQPMYLSHVASGFYNMNIFACEDNTPCTHAHSPIRPYPNEYTFYMIRVATYTHTPNQRTPKILMSNIIENDVDIDAENGILHELCTQHQREQHE